MPPRSNRKRQLPDPTKPTLTGKAEFTPRSFSSVRQCCKATLRLSRSSFGLAPAFRQHRLRSSGRAVSTLPVSTQSLRGSRQFLCSAGRVPLHCTPPSAQPLPVLLLACGLSQTRAAGLTALFLHGFLQTRGRLAAQSQR